MAAFRILLIVLLVTVVAYTVPVIANHGMNLMPPFFGAIGVMDWQGQFNLDFAGFLVLSGLWTAWRHHFSAAGLGLALLAASFGIPFLTIYLLVAIGKNPGDIIAVFAGPERAKAYRAA
ncbi:hypothetical protein [Alterisphingorhabdus coralli]|uniref:Uncharacterized protein n=1 Tax=Alterisphingorhabdus coralli TaxID=3071408 RepID=A0AA97F9M4_9SPHN|nr:hypothetical protein [Parasphingorhabdus sp. SCSIO 66989]WOE76071.1 hypothetical protein RB602_04960 [Parasphingorhabdus sp. SCSIO 66989]